MIECDQDMTIDECEQHIIKYNVEQIEERNKKLLLEGYNIGEIISIIEDFLRDTQRICYGGTAINNTLPKNLQFYDYTREIPDYDFYSPKPIQDCIDLVNIFMESGYPNAEARASNVHKGTFKVFVNNIPVADINYMDGKLYNSLHKHAVEIDGIFYAPIEFIRRNMFLELSRPKGEVSRWEKVVKRLNLFNSYYKNIAKDCNLDAIFERKNTEERNNILSKLKTLLIKEEAVFVGLFSKSIYFKYEPVKRNISLSQIPHFDILHGDPERVLDSIQRKFKDENIKVKEYPPIEKIIGRRYEVKHNGNTILHLYEPIVCHNYNEITYNNRKVKIGTIDTILSLYLVFLYLDNPKYDANRLLCLCDHLLKIQNEHRLSQRSPLRRYTMNCKGQQKTIIDLKQERERIHEKMKREKDKVRKRYDNYFFKYRPKETKKKRSRKTKTRKRRSTRNSNNQ